MKDELLKTITGLLEEKIAPTCLNKYKVKYRRAHVMKHLLKGRKQKEIAQMMGCSLSTIEKDVQYFKKYSRVITQ